MLPHPDYVPARASELPKVTLIPQAGLADFFLPERAYFVEPEGEPIAMPEVPVYEDGDFGTNEHNVWFSRESFDVLPEAKATAV